MILEKPREEFIELLSSCRYGLSSRDMVPALVCFCFYRNEVITFDDIVAVVAPCQMDAFEGGFKGSVLLNWLKSVSGGVVKLHDLGTGQHEWRAGRSRLRMAKLPREEFAFTIPRHEADEVTLVGFKDRLEVAASSMGFDPSQPWRLGVTITFNETGMMLYSSDNLSVTEVKYECEVPESLHGKEVILVPRLVEILLADKEDPKALSLVKSTIRFDYESDRRVYCRISTDVDCRKFRRVLSMVEWGKNFCQIPIRLETALNQTDVVLKGSNDPLCNLEVEEEGRLHISAKGANAEVKDRTKLSDYEGLAHPAVTVNLNPKTIQRVIEYVDDVYIDSNWVAFSGTDVRAVLSVFKD